MFTEAQKQSLRRFANFAVAKQKLVRNINLIKGGEQLKKQSAQLNIKNLKFEVQSEKPNWMPFSGVCCFVDTPSDGIPSGGVDKPVSFPRDEVEKSLDTIIDMGVNVEYPDDIFDSPNEMFGGHDTRYKIGVIKAGSIVGNEVQITGGLWCYDFSDVCDLIKTAQEALGWSVEVMMNIADQGEYYNAVDIEFTGACIMWSDKAAFKKTKLAASEKECDSGMNEDQIKALFAELTAQLMSTVQETVSAKFAEKEKAELEAKEQADKERLEAEALAKVELEEKQRVEAEAKAEEEKIQAELAEKARLELESQKAPERKTAAFGIIVGKFEGENDSEKAIMADPKLSGSEKFRKIVEAQLTEKK